MTQESTGGQLSTVLRGHSQKLTVHIKNHQKATVKMGTMHFTKSDCLAATLSVPSHDGELGSALRTRSQSPAAKQRGSG